MPLAHALSIAITGTPPMPMPRSTRVATPGGPNTVLIDMVEDSDYSGEFTTLTVADGNGIVALVGGLPWAGVTDLQLPFPN